MKIISSTLLGLVLLGTFTLAKADGCYRFTQPTPQEIQELVKQPHPNRGFLWRVQKGDRVGYVYGTLHAAKLDWNFPGPKVMHALRQTTALAVEMDLTAPDVLKKFAALSSAHREKSDASKSPVVQESKKYALDQIKNYCLDPVNFSQSSLRSLLTTVVIFSLQDEDLYAPYAIDMGLIGIAKAQKLPLVQLETPEVQVRALEEGFTDAMLQEMLAATKSGEAKKEMLQDVDAWASGNYEKASALKDKAEETALGKRDKKYLLDERDPVLAQHIDGFLQAHNHGFAAVGFNHLVGKKSVITYLQDMGYSATLIPFKN